MLTNLDWAKVSFSNIKPKDQLGFHQIENILCFKDTLRWKKVHRMEREPARSPYARSGQNPASIKNFNSSTTERQVRLLKKIGKTHKYPPKDTQTAKKHTQHKPKPLTSQPFISPLIHTFSYPPSVFPAGIMQMQCDE